MRTAEVLLLLLSILASSARAAPACILEEGVARLTWISPEEAVAGERQRANIEVRPTRDTPDGGYILVQTRGNHEPLASKIVVVRDAAGEEIQRYRPATDEIYDVPAGVTPSWDLLALPVWGAFPLTVVLGTSHVRCTWQVAADGRIRELRQ